MFDALVSFLCLIPEPNGSKSAFIFEDDLVAAQLRYTGMLDTIRIRKAGFTIRIPYDQFVKRFKVLIPTGLSSDPDHKKFQQP